MTFYRPHNPQPGGEIDFSLKDIDPGALFLGSALLTLLFLSLSDGAFLEPLIQWRNPYLPDATPMRLGFIAFSGVIGFGIGWLMSGAHKMLRSLVGGFLAGMFAFIVIYDQGFLGWGSSTIAAGLAFITGLGYWVRGFINRLAERPTTFGSAAWATIREMLAAGILTAEGFRLGFAVDAKGLHHALSYTDNRHMLTIAPNRSGKGTCIIIPNLLTYAGSILVIDPKGENAMITATHREGMGQEVHVVDPWSITGLTVSRFNPLDWLVAGDIDIGDNAMLLADAIVIAMGSNDKFWDEEGKALLVGVLLYVALAPEEEGQRHLGRVRDLLLLDGEDLIKLFRQMVKSPHAMVRSAGARCLQKEEKLLSNVLASVQAQTHFLDSPRLRDSLSVSDFRFEDLKEKRVTIYLVLPSDRLNSHGRFLRLLIQQALTVNARNIERKPEKSVLFILDEMPALGRLTMVEQAFGLMAGYGMQIHGVCQDASQLKRIYGDGWETFVANAGVIQYFGSRDRMTAEYFSKLCGVTTVWNFSTALARAVGVTHGKDTSTSKTTTDTDTATGTQRQLAYADELMRMPQDRQLILMSNMNPIMAKKVPWFEDPALKGLGVNLQAPDGTPDAT